MLTLSALLTHSLMFELHLVALSVSCKITWLFAGRFPAALPGLEPAALPGREPAALPGREPALPGLFLSADALCQRLC